MDIRQQVIKRIKELNVSIRQLSKETNISASMLYKYRDGLNGLSEDKLKRLLKRLDISFIAIDNQIIRDINLK